ncbi:lipocalin family protein [Zunongwangia sp. F363]|uniref:Lipocalin family protein n=1 Tax=Autumnicola tepida TaxID=3075595 RepID=A0ABU3C992_9FLAO|nr:lipocalin family protein [Zunongwangia sp. F363]MDT0642896.1 lipocalin family protein [Zunongwangia sp. F363]
MKVLLQLSSLALLLMIFGCNSEEEEITVLDVNVQNITGTWELTESYVSPGGETEWRPVKNGNIYTFFDNGKFSSSGRQNCSEGEFTLEDNILQLDCEEEHLSWRVDTLGSRVMILGGIGCIEACLYKYKRID